METPIRTLSVREPAVLLDEYYDGRFRQLARRIDRDEAIFAMELTQVEQTMLAEWFQAKADLIETTRNSLDRKVLHRDACDVYKAVGKAEAQKIGPDAVADVWAEFAVEHDMDTDGGDG